MSTPRPKTKRRRRALLGEITRVGLFPVFAWVERDRLHFHRLHDRSDPPPIALSEIYRKAAGLLL